ncbi:IS256 family transposase [Gordonia sp. HY285]|nr:IS256 family transposase [Gordonia liuliyuniae]MCF8609005.1 IS256 family transposase [Gordonia liuliyuniae]
MDDSRAEQRRRQTEMAGELIASGALDEVFVRIDAGEPVGGQDGLLNSLLKATLERVLNSELSEHVGYEAGDPEAASYPNSRNGFSPKTVATEVGDVDLAIPRDRDGTFTPMLVRKGQRRLDGLDAMIVSLYAGGMTIRDIAHHLASTIGTELSHETISKITEEVADEVAKWQTRDLEALYPVIYLDAIIVKIRDGGHVRNKAAHLAVGVDMDGVKHVLGIWIQQTEGAKFWAAVCAELRNRGVADVLIVCCDGLTGFADAVEVTWPQATVQTCVVHLIRASMRFVGYGDRKAVAGLLKPIYQAPTEQAAADALDAFADSDMGRKYPSAVKTFRDAWERFIPFLAFPPELRRVIYTTNSHRIAQLSTAEGDQESRALPERPGRDETALDGDLQHRGQTSSRTRQGTRPSRQQAPRFRTIDRRRGHDQLETRPRATLTRVPGPYQPPPINRTPDRLTQKT